MEIPSDALSRNKRILLESSRLLVRHLFDRTVTLGLMADDRLVDHGTGMLLRVGEDHLVITAAHVIRRHDPCRIQIISTDHLSDERFQPSVGDLYGGRADSILDVGFLKIPDPSHPSLRSKVFMELDDLECFPNGLSSDLSILFGMPEELRVERSEDSHTFRSFAYMNSFDGDCDWSEPGNRPLTMSVSFEERIQDVFSDEEVAMPNPAGMSGGGLWRAHLSTPGIWTPDSLRLIGIITEFDGEGRVVANRVESLLHLLSNHYDLPIPTPG